MTDAFTAALSRRGQDILDNCIHCGACFDVCPMTGPAGLAEADSAAVTRGVLDLLKGDEAPAESIRWAEVCSGSGWCIPTCNHGVNPRFMLSLARLHLRQQTGEAERHAQGGASFAAMSRGVRVLSRLQLAPEVQESLHSDADSVSDPEVVFYTGCQVLKTPHIALLCLDILDALGIRYQVMGGPRDCCGVLQYRAGDIAVSGRIGTRTTDRFADTGAPEVLSWCPTCQIQLGENFLPGRQGGEPGSVPFELSPFVVYLADHLAQLQPLLRVPVHKTVGLHEHPGVAGVTDAARTILRAIPGLTYVELEQPRVGWMCNTLQSLPEYKREVHHSLLSAAADAGVTTLAGVYHACHRDLCAHERDWPFEVVNFLELVGESMGIRREDQFKRLKMMQDVDAIVAEVADVADKAGLKLEQVREVVARDLLGEQPLPLGQPKDQRQPQ